MMRADDAGGALGNDRWIGTAEVARILNFSKVHVRRLERAGRIPKSTPIGLRKKAWRLSAIQQLGV
jgi:predicted DNA-binding transcriptional regulator AlpA